MRSIFVILALAIAGVVILAACRARDETVADSAASDTASGSDSLAAASPEVSRDTVARAPAAAARARPSPGASDTDRRQAQDTAVPSQDSLRAMRPKLPEVTPDRPREWRGLKLPEERRARAPVAPINRVDSVPDSVLRETPRPEDR